MTPTRSALLLLASGCWTGSAPPVTPPATAAPAAPIVTVRLAREGEYPDDDDEDGANWTPAHDLEGLACPLDGSEDRTLVDPVVAFARTELVPRIARFGPVTLPVPFVVLPDIDAPTPETTSPVISILPRTAQGILELSAWWNDGSASMYYCMHVVRSRNKVQVIIEPRGMTRTVS